MKSRNPFTFICLIAVYALLLITTLGPLDPFREVWGQNNLDVYNHLHLLQWQAHEAAAGRPFPTHNRFLHFPDGGVIFLADAVGQTTLIPLVWLAGPVFGYNALIFLSLLFACWTMFWLVKKRTGDPWAAFLAGGLFGLCPEVLSHVNNGVIEMLQVGWLPLFLFVLFSLFDTLPASASRKRRNWLIVAAAGTWSAAALAGHWYYGMYAALLMGCAMVVYSFRYDRIKTWKRSAAVIVLFSLTIAPAAYLFHRTSQDPDKLTRSIEKANTYENTSADPARFFSITPMTSKTSRKPLASQDYLHPAYLGFVLPVLVIIAIINPRRRRKTLLWSAGALFFGLLALGPYLVFNQKPVTLAGHSIPLPYLLFMKIIPFFHSMDFPYRFFILVHLCLAAAVGTGFASRWDNRKWRGLVYLALLGLAWSEIVLFAWIPIPAFRQTIAPRGPIARMAESKEDFAVFDLPILARKEALNRYVTNQLFHHRPILYSNFSTVSHPFSRSLANQNLAVNLLALAGYPDQPLTVSTGNLFDQFPKMGRLDQAGDALVCLSEPGPDCETLLQEVEKDLDQLASLGITRFLLHEDLLVEDSRLPEVVIHLLGTAVAERDNIKLFRL